MFDENHFCSFNLSIASVLMDYRFRTKPQKRIQEDVLSADMTRKESVSSKKKIERRQTLTKDLTPKLPRVPTTVAEWFFGGDDGELPEEVEANIVDSLYATYNRVIDTMYAKLKGWYDE